MPLKYMLLADTLKNEMIELADQGIRRLPTEMELMKQHGVSRQTVRRALSLLLSEDLIEKRQGSGSYISDHVFSSMAPPQTIAILAPFANDYTFSAPFQDVQSVFSKAGYQLQVFLTENSIWKERQMLQSLLEHPVRGMLIQGTRNAFPNPNIDLYKQLISQGIRILFMGTAYAGLGDVPCLTTDDYAGGYLLTHHLIQQKHRRIAGIFRSDDISGHQRYLGCSCALRDEGLSIDDTHFFWYDRSRQDSAQEPLNFHLLEPFLQKRLPDCSAVVCQDDEVACFLIRTLQRHNIRVPQQMSVVGFGSSYFSEISPVRITTVTPGNGNLWNHAAWGLLQLLKGKNFLSVPFSWTLLKRDSDMPAAL